MYAGIYLVSNNVVYLYYLSVAYPSNWCKCICCGGGGGGCGFFFFFFFFPR